MIQTLIIFALVAVILFFIFRPRREKKTANIPYLEALIAELEKNDELAIKKFKEALNIDTNLIDAYVRLGNLYRKKGDVPRAIQIHQSLTVRPTIKKDEEKKVYFALTDDYIISNRPNKAVSFLKEILKIDKNDKQARDLILTIFENLGNYSDCISIYEEYATGEQDEKRRAFYYASLANAKLKEPGEEKDDAEKEAVNLFKKALKIKSDSLTALYSCAEYAKNKGDAKKAKEYYLKIVCSIPDFTFLIIQDLEKVLYETGAFEQIIPIYEKVFKANPRNFAVGMALSNLYEKKNEIEMAKDIYRKISDLNPKSIIPRMKILRLASQDRTTKKEIAEFEKLFAEREFTCQKCGFKINKFSFLCQKCHAIESFLPRL